jgi:AraC family transcriptional activator of tynA and feaB
MLRWPGRFGGRRTILRSYSTDDVEGRSRLAYWTDLHWECFCPVAITPASADDFRARFSIGTVGSLAIAETNSMPAALEHDERHLVESPAKRFSMLMALDGTIQVSHRGNKIALEPGDWTLLDRLASSHLSFHAPNRAISVHVPQMALDRFLPTRTDLCGRAMRGGMGFGSTLRSAVMSVWERMHGDIEPSAETILVDVLLRLIAASCALEHKEEPSGKTIASARKTQIRHFIEAHLRDADLSVERIAHSLDISPRYVRMIFATESESVTAYILRRRLERCAEIIVDPLLQHRTLTETAFEWGFSNMAHFSRAFKRHFGVSPTEFRSSREAIAADAAQISDWRRARSA